MLTRCANPVPPLGGEKDTTKPILISVSNIDKGEKQIVRIQFSENIQTKNSVIVSPILTTAITPSTSIKRNRIDIETSKVTNTIYLNGFIIDLNENNPVSQPALLLKNDTGELIVNLPKDDIKTKKKVFIRDLNRYTYSTKPFINELIYLPTTQDNINYRFHGLTDSLHVLFVIYEDNDYQVAQNEKANCLVINNNNADTLVVSNVNKNKNYKSAFKYKDSLYLITEPRISKFWFDNNKINSFYRDSLFITKENIDEIRKALRIDSFTLLTRINTSPSINHQYYTINSSLDTIVVKTPYHYNYNNSAQTNKKKIKTGLLTIRNPNKYTIYNSIDIGLSQFIVKVEGNSSDSFYLPEGSYNIMSWIPNLNTNNSLSPNIIDYQNQIPLDNREMIFKPKNSVIVSSKLDNTLILPEINSFNTGITFK